MIINKKIITAIAIIIIVVLTSGIVVSSKPETYFKGRSFRIENGDGNKMEEDRQDNADVVAPIAKKDRSPLSGLECDNAKRRPLAVMMAGDLEAWPLSGIGDADMVIEMPVVTDGITRYMAVFICNDPKEIGSVRSARHDFIPLAMGLDAIFAHWGGSHFALDKLDNKIMNNINALYLDGSVFYRKASFPKPHDGFTTMEKMLDYSKKMDYRMENGFAGYNFYDDENPMDKDGELSIAYPSVYEVDYTYNHKTNSYLRYKGKKKDIDKLTSKQVAVKNVVIMYAESKQIEGQYNSVAIEGSGDAVIYQNGLEIKGKWKKDKGDRKSKLYFYNESGEEAKFVSGQTWIQIVQPNQEAKWSIME